VLESHPQVTNNRDQRDTGAGRVPPPVFFVTRPVAGVCAVTDRGQPIPLFHYEALLAASAAELSGRQAALATAQGRREFLLEMEGQFLDRVFPNKQEVFRLAEPSPLYNCHGWIFSGGRFGIEDAFVARILEDNSYSSVPQPDEGDLVIYRQGADAVHSGYVRSVEQGVVVVMSKWGPFGVFLHPVEAQPFSPDWTFHRTTRGGHQLLIDRRAAVDLPGA